MIKLIYAVSLLMLVAAGAVFTLSGKLWSQDMAVNQSSSETSVVERFQTLGNLQGDKGRDSEPPLVKQATAYALYLVPPAPKVRTTAGNTRITPTVQRPAGMQPKFRLLSTSYCRSSPDLSWALVSEPGKGDHWVKKDARLGHYIVDSVKDGSIVYRDGSRLHEVKIPEKQTVQLAKINPAVSASAPAVNSKISPPNDPQATEVK